MGVTRGHPGREASGDLDRRRGGHLLRRPLRIDQGAGHLRGAEGLRLRPVPFTFRAVMRDARYDRLRASLPELIGALDSFAGVFRSTGAPAS
jgi:hypothetical protein